MWWKNNIEYKLKMKLNLKNPIVFFDLRCV